MPYNLPHASHCGAQSGVLGADGIRKKGLFEKIRLLYDSAAVECFFAVSWVVFIAL
jgi:hypothetical protein